MRNDVLFRCLVLGLTAAFGLIGCGSDEGDGNVTPGFPDQTGQLPRGSWALPYPAGPFGISKGSIAQNYELIGFPNAKEKIGDGVRFISFAEFYNPTGDGVFPENSVFPAGTPKPKALAIIISASWCGPCQYEAAEVLPGLRAEYNPIGGEFLLALAEGISGSPATPDDLTKWVKKFAVDYPSVTDPGGKLAALWESDSFPANIIINTRTMEIVHTYAGPPPATYWKTFEKVIAGTL
ncbi:MAG TPA: TlpA disulfide reductase family protein [Polyangium sp.]|nr:TlpA disulfide reductase family protein [Polyangium sp.]